MRIRLPSFLIAVFLFAAHNVTAQTEAGTSILFVGNSYTYFWNLPQTVEAMARAGDYPLRARQSTAGGTNWGQHWRGEKGLKSLDRIRSGDFDLVILQNHSRRALDAPDSLLHYGRRLIGLAREQGSIPILYETWARKWDPTMQDTITATYDRLARETGCRIAPVGQAWSRALRLRPYLPLYDPDQSHPSPMGTYLTACVFYRVLTGKSPVGLPHRILISDQHGEKLYLNIQSKEDALFCQEVADEVVTRQAARERDGAEAESDW